MISTFKYIIAFCSILSLFVSCNRQNTKSDSVKTESVNETEIPVYRIPRVSSTPMNIDAMRDEQIWNKALSIDKFINPWSNKFNPKTNVSLVADANFLYFFFEVLDNDIVIIEEFTDEINVADEDRVELFFSKDLKMDKYYGFEFDPKGRVLDYWVKYYRDFHYDWNYDEIKVEGKINRNGYSVEGAIPLDFFKEIMNDRNEFFWGAYRGEFGYGNKKGEVIQNWLTIKDPQTENPDFHVPSSLCKIILENN